jgi:rare lipoprotein A (peptidoglycan hydrolase)
MLRRPTHAHRKSLKGAHSMKPVGLGLLIGLAAILATTLVTLTAADAAGWGSVHRYVKPSGNCAGQEVLASSYASGRRTANGERFDANGNTAAARTWPLGATLTVTNPHNGRSVTVRINDRGPWGLSYRMGARLDLARGAARRLGMRGSQYVCVV